MSTLCCAITGPRGPKGIAGSAGPPGANGIDGTPGAIGATGLAGSPGQKGEQGRGGSRGPPGVVKYENGTEIVVNDNWNQCYWDGLNSDKNYGLIAVSVYDVVCLHLWIINSNVMIGPLIIAIRILAIRILRNHLYV